MKINQILKDNFAVKQREKKLLYESKQAEISHDINKLQEELKEMEVIKKQDLSEEYSKEEKEIIENRLKKQQELFAMYQERRKERLIYELEEKLYFFTRIEITHGLIHSKVNEDDLIYQFQDPLFIKKIRQELAIQQLNSRQQAEQDDLTDKRKKKKNMGLVKSSKFKVDEGLEMLKDGGGTEQVFEGWSQARIKAFNQIEKKPNAYYYRFNTPGESQCSGAWSKQEKALFIERLKQVGADGKWGLFSMTIPGRVGYQVTWLYNQSVPTFTDN